MKKRKAGEDYSRVTKFFKAVQESEYDEQKSRGPRRDFRQVSVRVTPTDAGHDQGTLRKSSRLNSVTDTPTCVTDQKSVERRTSKRLRDKNSSSKTSSSDKKVKDAKTIVTGARHSASCEDVETSSSKRLRTRQNSDIENFEQSEEMYGRYAESWNHTAHNGGNYHRPYRDRFSGWRHDNSQMSQGRPNFTGNICDYDERQYHHRGHSAHFQDFSGGDSFYPEDINVNNFSEHREENHYNRRLSPPEMNRWGRGNYNTGGWNRARPSASWSGSTEESGYRNTRSSGYVPHSAHGAQKYQRRSQPQSTKPAPGNSKAKASASVGQNNQGQLASRSDGNLQSGSRSSRQGQRTHPATTSGKCLTEFEKNKRENDKLKKESFKTQKGESGNCSQLNGNKKVLETMATDASNSRTKKAASEMENCEGTADSNHGKSQCSNGKESLRTQNINSGQMLPATSSTGSQTVVANKAVATATPVNKTPASAPVNKTPASTTVNKTPASTPVNKTPASTPVNKTPASTQVNKTPASAPVNKTPASTPVNKTPASTPVNKTPASTQVNKTPASTPVNKTPASAPVNKTPASAPVNKTPASALVNKTPASTQVNKTPGSAPVNKTPASAPVNDTPASAPVNKTPASTTVNKTPASAPVNKIPAIITWYKTPSATSGNKLVTATTVVSKTPVTTTASKTPVTTTVSKTPVTTTVSKTPVTTTVSKTPVTTTVSKTPVTTTVSKTPVTTTVSKTPVTTTVSKTAASTTVSKTPSATAGSRTPVSTTVNKTPATTAMSKTSDSTAASKTPATTAVSRTPANTAASKTPATTAVSKTPDRTTASKTSASTAVSKTPATAAVSKTSASTAVSKTPASTAASKTPATTSVRKTSATTVMGTTSIIAVTKTPPIAAVRETPASIPVSETPVSTAVVKTLSIPAVSKSPTTTTVNKAPASIPVGDTQATSSVSDPPASASLSKTPASTPRSEIPATTSVNTTPSSSVSLNKTSAIISWFKTSNTSVNKSLTTFDTVNKMPSTAAANKTPATTAVSKVSATTVVSKTPVTSPVSKTPARTAVSKTPVTTPVSKTPVTTPVSKTPTTTAVSKTPVTTPVSKTPATTAVSKKPVTTPVSKTPAKTAVSKTPVTTPVSKTPATTAVSKTPVTTPVSKTPATSAVMKTSATTAMSTTPTIAVSKTPGTATVSKTPASTPVSESPSADSVSKTPATTTPFFTAVSKTPTTAAVMKTSAATEVRKTLTTTAVSKTPATTTVGETQATSSVSDPPASASLIKTPASTPRSEIPVTTLVNTTPTTPSVNTTPTTPSVNKTPSSSVSLNKTPAIISGYGTDTSVNKSVAASDTVNKMPATAAVNKTPAMAPVNETPVNTAVNKTPVTAEVNKTLVTTSVNTHVIKTPASTSVKASTSMNKTPATTSLKTTPVTTSVTETVTATASVIKVPAVSSQNTSISAAKSGVMDLDQSSATSADNKDTSKEHVDAAVRDNSAGIQRCDTSDGSAQDLVKPFEGVNCHQISTGQKKTLKEVDHEIVSWQSQNTKIVLKDVSIVVKKCDTSGARNSGSQVVKAPDKVGIALVPSCSNTKDAVSNTAGTKPVLKDEQMKGSKLRSESWGSHAEGDVSSSRVSSSSYDNGLSVRPVAHQKPSDGREPYSDKTTGSVRHAVVGSQAEESNAAADGHRSQYPESENPGCRKSGKQRSQYSESDRQRSQYSESDKHGSPYHESNKHRSQYSESDKHGSRYHESNKHRSKNSESDRQRSQYSESDEHGSPYHESNKHRSQYSESDRQRSQYSESDKHGSPYRESNKHRSQYSESDKHGSPYHKSNKHRSQYSESKKNRSHYKQGSDKHGYNNPDESEKHHEQAQDHKHRSVNSGGPASSPTGYSPQRPRKRKHSGQQASSSSDEGGRVRHHSSDKPHGGPSSTVSPSGKQKTPSPRTVDKYKSGRVSQEAGSHKDLFITPIKIGTQESPRETQGCQKGNPVYRIKHRSGSCTGMEHVSPLSNLEFTFKERCERPARPVREAEKPTVDKDLSQDSFEDNYDSEDDSFLDTVPAFLQTIQAARSVTVLSSTPLATEPAQVCERTEVLSDEEFVVQARPPAKALNYKFSLDTLLTEKIEKEENNRELEAMQLELKEGIKQGGFVRLTLDAEPEQTELLPEHQEQLQILAVSEQKILEIHPGVRVFSGTRYKCLFTENLRLATCGFTPGTSHIDKYLATIQPEWLFDLLTSKLLAISFEKLSCLDAVLTWLFYIMSVHPSLMVVDGCRQDMGEVLIRQQDFHTDKVTWCPPLKAILRVLLNYGSCLSSLCQDRRLLGLSEEEIRELETPLEESRGENLPAEGQVGANRRLNRENFRQVVQVIAVGLQGRPDYSTSQLMALAVILCNSALDSLLVNYELHHEFLVCLAHLLEQFPKNEWPKQAESMCHHLSKITAQHHNKVYLVQLFPLTVRGQYIQRRLSYVILCDLMNLKLQGQNLHGLKVEYLKPVVPKMRQLVCSDLYLLSSVVTLMEKCVGNEDLMLSEKKDLRTLMELVRTVAGEVRDSVTMLDRTKVKDMMVRLTSVWTFKMQSMGSKQPSLFAWRKQDSPVKVRVETLSSQQSDSGSDESEEEDDISDKTEPEKSGPTGSCADENEKTADSLCSETMASMSQEVELSSQEADRRSLQRLLDTDEDVLPEL